MRKTKKGSDILHVAFSSERRIIFDQKKNIGNIKS